MVFCIVGFIYAVFILPELKGLSLEEVDSIFNDRSGAEDRERRERIAKQIGLDKAAADVRHDENATLAGDHGEKGTSDFKGGSRFGARAAAAQEGGAGGVAKI